MLNVIKINEKDNVAVALSPLSAGSELYGVTLCTDVPQGHKFSLTPIKKGENIIKYGYPIGHASSDIEPGCWVHTHNLKTNLGEIYNYEYKPAIKEMPRVAPTTFEGYLRPDGRAAVRNEIWIVPTVGCVNAIGDNLIRDAQHLVKGSIDSMINLAHPFGCGQMGEDNEITRKALAAMVNHPNAGAVLVLGLGCEYNNIPVFQEELGEWDSDRVKFLNCQTSSDEYADGAALLKELAEYAGQFKRQPISTEKLVVGLKCGGSDGLSGITANPLIGAFSDMLISQGGSTILTEVSEMFGSETIITNRAINEDVFNRSVKMINDVKEFYIRHDQVIYENPSPGNKDGGISSLEDKSLGCTQKGGTAPVVDVIEYAGQIKTRGLNLLSSPSSDIVSANALAMAGAHIVLFSTGRGTPFACPAPTVKVATNTDLFNHKRNWLDFNAGVLAQGASMEEVSRDFFDYIISVASGEKTMGEIHGTRDFTIFKQGVTL
ncbi:MAG: UxaA family hydrolase [Christensenellales bacterium]|jgi:altronate hydrolase